MFLVHLQLFCEQQFQVTKINSIIFYLSQHFSFAMVGRTVKGL